MSFSISEDDAHPHLRARMEQRGITWSEIEQTLVDGWAAADAKAGTFGRTMVLRHERQWEGEYYPEKEVTVYFKRRGDQTILLTAKARYGRAFPRR